MVLESPRRAVDRVLGGLAPMFLEGGQRLYLVDGANCFNPYVFSGEARRRGIREDVLDRIFVTRVFTIHQIAAVTAEMLPPLVRGVPGAVLGVLGLDHLFLEESLRTAERSRVLNVVLEDLRRLRRDGGRLLVTHESLPRGQRWWQPLMDFGDIRCRAHGVEKDEWKLEVVRCADGANIADIQCLASGGNRFLERFSPRSAGGATGGV